MSRFEMVQCDAWYEGCESETQVDNAVGWLLDTPLDYCPSCADIRALDAEFDLAESDQ